jgi:hypothetical protein
MKEIKIRYALPPSRHRVPLWQQTRHIDSHIPQKTQRTRRQLIFLPCQLNPTRPFNPSISFPPRRMLWILPCVDFLVHSKCCVLGEGVFVSRRGREHFWVRRILCEWNSASKGRGWLDDLMWTCSGRRWRDGPKDVVACYSRCSLVVEEVKA